MLITGSFAGSDQATLAKLQNATRLILAGLRVQIDREMLKLRTYIVAEKLSGQVLHRREGTLSDSVHEVPATIEGDTVTGGIEAAGGPAFYGEYFEKGGEKSYPITPQSAKALAFFPSSGFVPRNEVIMSSIRRGLQSPNSSLRTNSQSQFRNLGGVVVKSVMHPPIPKLPWFAPSLEEKRQSIIAALRLVANRALQEGKA